MDPTPQHASEHPKIRPKNCQEMCSPPKNTPVPTFLVLVFGAPGLRSKNPRPTALAQLKPPTPRRPKALTVASRTCQSSVFAPGFRPVFKAKKEGKREGGKKPREFLAIFWPRDAKSLEKLDFRAIFWRSSELFR